MKRTGFLNVRIAVLAVLVLGAFAVVGCGKSDQGLLAPQQNAVQANPGATDGFFVIDFSRSKEGALNAPFAAKKAKKDKKDEKVDEIEKIYDLDRIEKNEKIDSNERVRGIEADWFSPEIGGKLEVKFDYKIDKKASDRNLDIRLQRAKFEVEKGSLEDSHRIQMQVTAGTRMEHIKVKFTPVGLTFNPSAKLTLELEGKLNKGERDRLTAYHVSGDGKVTVVQLKITDQRDYVKLEIEVPGFSSYSMGGDDDFAPEAEIY